MIKHIFMLICIIYSLNAENAETVRRTDWKYNTTDTLQTANPSQLKYFKYYDNLPDEINLKIFNEQDLSHLAGKKVVVGYGVADKKGTDCKVFLASDIGELQDITVCLPWWRIEREYKRKDAANSGLSVIDKLKTPKAPMTINYCGAYSDGKDYPGGLVACTTYFDRNAGGDCWDNPEQQECYVDNCGIEVKERCDYLDSATGKVETLPSSVLDSTGTPTQMETKVKLTSHRYECPSGPLVSEVECTDEQNVIVYPFECALDNPATEIDDGEYIYCDENRPIKDAAGKVEAFAGTCSDGREVRCEANKFQNTTRICVEPIYETEIISELKGTEMQRTYDEMIVDVLSGEPDVYSSDENCLRANTVEDAREQELYVKIVGSGSLDDDIYILKHKTDGSHSKIYCNMQHAEDKGSRKSYNGEVLQCIDNNGSYSFNQTVSIDTTDIVSVQQNSENENATGTPFALGRNHYSSTKVAIDGIEVAPNTYPSNFPYYPKNGSHLRTWDNTNSTLSILFPFAGAYELYFYNAQNEEMAVAYLDIEDFKEIAINGSLQLMLGRQMKLAPGMQESSANRDDMWVEWGGGTYGGKNSKTGATVSSPKDGYVKDNAVTNIIAKDLLTGAIVPIPLTYPVAYPNRIFISKLKVYEYRKYRCYDDFPEFNLLGEQAETRFVCSNTQQWQDYKNGFEPDVGDLQQWDNKGLCEQNCRDTFVCSPKIEVGVNGFTCSQRGGENLGGDLGGNFFSNIDDCNATCFAQQECKDYTESNCNIVEEQVSEPISDWTGKTLFKNKSITYRCETQFDKQIGCNKYDVKVTEGDVSFSFGAIGTETKNFIDTFDDALTKAHMMEVGQQHIFSGWEGKCVYGMKWDFSYLGDPMTIMSYAMGAYSSMQQMGEWGVGWAENMTEKFDTFVDGIGDSVTDGMESLKESTIGDAFKAGTEEGSKTVNAVVKEAANKGTISPSLNGLKNLEKIVNDAQATMLDNIKEVADTQLQKLFGPAFKLENTAVIGGVELRIDDFVNVTNQKLLVFGFKSAMAIAAPSEQDYQTADRLLKGYSGIDTSNTEAHNYNACMASIGASLPNLIGWSVDSAEHESEQLLAPWKHPLRMTGEQLAAIATVKGENYVTSQFLIQETDSILMNVMIISPQAYLESAKTICMGTKVSQAASHIENENNSNPSSSSGVALGIAKAALGMVCAPCSFAMTIVMDLVNNVFAKIDTCKNEDDAIQWDINDFKTNKFMNKEQCHYVQKECDKKVNFGFGSKCVRHRKEYCCYDQITTRIFSEGLKAQKYAENDPAMWDSCSDITVDDLKDVVFRECNPGEIAYVNKCIPTNIYNNFQQTLFRQASKSIDTNISAGLLDQAINSMAIQKAKE